MGLLRAVSEVRPKEGYLAIRNQPPNFPSIPRKLDPTPASESRAHKRQLAREMTEPHLITSHIPMAPHLRLNYQDGSRPHVTMP